MNNYDWLISRLDAFIRKYYANQLIRGTLVLLSCLLAYILTVSVGEYFLYMPVWLRLTIVTLFIVLGAAALVAWVIIPLTKMNRLGKVISHEQAAAIVGKHFPEISDKLLNILQLKKQHDGISSIELIEASINQKAAQISVIPITSAIDYSKNKKFLRFLLPLLLVGVFILVAAPNVFKDASKRLLQPTKSFEKPAPFQFIIQNNKLQTVRNQDFALQVKTTGSALPAEVFVAIGDDKIPMQTLEQNKFQYNFRNITEPVHFKMFAAGFYSKEYTLNVVQKPVLKAFKVNLDYPDYTGKKDEIRTSLGDMTIPVGTHVSWAFVAEHTDEAGIKLGNGQSIKLPKQANIFASTYRFMNDTTYTLSLYNKQAGVADSYHYQVKVIPDQYPVIQLQEFRDTVSGKQILLNGTAGDDYAITKVLFHYEVTDNKEHVLLNKAIPLKTTAGSLTSFQHYFDVQVLNLQPGQKLSYFIEAWDNDGVHGSKASRSEVMSYQMFSPTQLDSAINANADQINSGLSNSSEHTQQLQSEYKDLQSKLLQSDNMNWEQQQSLQELSKKQMELQNKMEAVKKRFEEQVQQSKQKQYSDEVKDKQEDLKSQMDNLMNKELQEQLKKLQELMQKLNKDQAFQTMKELEQENKLFNMDLQRMQELMKQLEMQMRMEDLANKMDDLAKKQLDLKDQTDKSKKDNQALSKEQDALKKELDKAMNEDMKELKEQNKEAKQQQDVDQPKEAGEKAQQEMSDSKDELEKNENSKSSGSQSKAAQNLQSMSQSLRSMSGNMNLKQIEIDIRATRQILTNLIRLSFDEEQLMKKVQNTSPASQTYLTNQKEQDRLHANSKMIRDSLFALSKRVSMLSAGVNKETTELEKNLAVAVDALEARRISDATTRQQYVMTHTNNLALMLNELLSNLLQKQNQAKQNGQKGSCNTPGGMKPKPGATGGMQLGDIITKQKQLGDAMKQMQDAMQKKEGQGDKTGEGKPKQGQGAANSSEAGEPSEQLAKMAQQQAALRRQIQQLSSLLNSKGMGNAKELKEIQDKMDRTETDLVNRRFNNELLLRQKEILTRLLETEKSLREQEQDDKRSSHTADEISRAVPPELQQFMREHQQLLEQYKTVPPQLKPYYRNMVQQYYQMIGSK
jgi:hypothetical protein